MLLLVGAVLVSVFGDEDAFARLGNQQLGLGFLGAGGGMFCLSHFGKKQRKKVRKNHCLECGYKWEEIL